MTNLASSTCVRSMRERRVEIVLLECRERFIDIVPVACSVVRNGKGSQERMCITAAGEMSKFTLEKKRWRKHYIFRQVQPEKTASGKQKRKTKMKQQRLGHVILVKLAKRTLLWCLHVETSSGRLFRRFSLGHKMITSFFNKQRWHFLDEAL